MYENELRRLSQLTAQFPLRVAVEVTIEQLELCFSCSRRNVSNILAQLATLEWIRWSPAIGRGKQNCLTLQLSPEEVLCTWMEEALACADFEKVAKWLTHFGDKAADAFQQAKLRHARHNHEQACLHIGHFPWVNTLDARQSFRCAELQVIGSLYDTLLVLDGERLLPSLAHHWEVEGRHLRFWLRQDVHWHDGSALLAEAVVDSLTHLSRDPGPMAGLFHQIVAVRGPSPYMVELELQNPNPFFIYALATTHAAILSSQQRDYGEGRFAHLGSGPFMLEQWARDRVILRRNPGYFGIGALLEQITLDIGILPQILTDTLTFSQVPTGDDAIKLQAFSYVSVRSGPRPGISEEGLGQLLDYLDWAKQGVTEEIAVQGARGAPALSTSKPCPALQGHLVLAEPVWTIPRLARLSAWLQQAIRGTGVTLEVRSFTTISDPGALPAEVDMLFVEEVLETPMGYGLYEWLLSASGVRFGMTPDEQLLHRQRIAVAVSRGEQEALRELSVLEQEWYQQHRYLPLFMGQEMVNMTSRVRGFELLPTGYCPFHKLWLGEC